MAKNAYRNTPLSDEQQDELQETVEEKADESRNFIKRVFSADSYSSRSFVTYVPFIAFLGFLAMTYIANRHFAESTVRQIDRLSREVKEMSWDYKALSADLMQQSTQSEIAKKVDSMGLKERTQPPRKIVITK